MLLDVPIVMSTTENPKSDTTEPELVPPEEPAPEVKTSKPKSKPEPKPPASSEPKPDVSKCNLSAEGTFDKGVADCKLKKSSTLEIERTQILILVKDGRRYTYNRTNIE